MSAFGLLKSSLPLDNWNSHGRRNSFQLSNRSNFRNFFLMRSIFQGGFLFSVVGMSFHVSIIKLVLNNTPQNALQSTLDNWNPYNWNPL